MSWLRRGEDDEAIEEAMRPKGCRSCGRTFGNNAAWTIHLEHGGPGSRCLPGDAYGQLVDVDGVWVCLGDAAR